MQSMRSRVFAAVAATLAVAGVAVVALAFRGVHPRPASSGPCPVKTDLGRIAYLRGGGVHVVDLRTCRDRVVARGAAAPVRWSPDGRWVAFGDGRVVPSAGGRIRRPLGTSAAAWTWSPARDELAGVTRAGGVVLGGPRERTRRLLADGWGAGNVAFDRGGSRLAVDRRVQRGFRVLRQALAVVDLPSGRTRTVYRPPARTVSAAP